MPPNEFSVFKDNHEIRIIGHYDDNKQAILAAHKYHESNPQFLGHFLRVEDVYGQPIDPDESGFTLFK